MLGYTCFTVMASTLHTIQIISALALIVLVLLNRSTGDAGSSFGGGSFLHTRRGSERFLFVLTIVVSVVFAASSIIVIALAK